MATNMDVYSNHRTPSFFARLDDNERTRLLDISVTQELRRNQVIFCVGDLPDYVYIVQSGRVRISHLSTGGRVVSLWFCVAEDIFGLTELCHGGHRQVCAQACERSNVLRIARADFSHFLEHTPRAALAALDVVSARLRGLGRVVEGLVECDVSERLTQLIQRLCLEHGHAVGDHICIDLHLTHQDIADMIGATRQTVTSTLGDLRRSGVLTLSERRWHVARQMLDAGAKPAGAE
jgi:CRP-like cAMP-binding protein